MCVGKIVGGSFSSVPKSFKTNEGTKLNLTAWHKLDQDWDDDDLNRASGLKIRSTSQHRLAQVSPEVVLNKRTDKKGDNELETRQKIFFDAFLLSSFFLAPWKNPEIKKIPIYETVNILDLYRAYQWPWA